MKSTLSFSEMSAFLDCRKKWKFRYLDGLIPKKTDIKLRVGSAFHKGFEFDFLNKSPKEIEYAFMEKLAEGFTEHDWTDEFRTDAKFWLKLFWEALKEFHSKIDVTPIEPELNCEIAIPDRKMKYKCKIDSTVDYKDNLFLLEHKTKAAIGPALFFELQVDEQITGYLWAQSKLQKKLAIGVIYNIIRKPNAKVKDRDKWLEKNMGNLTQQEIVYRSPDEIQQFEEMLVNFVPNIRHPSICRRVSMECSWKCAYRSLCIEDTPEARAAFKTKTSQAGLGQDSRNLLPGPAIKGGSANDKVVPF